MSGTFLSLFLPISQMRTDLFCPLPRIDCFKIQIWSFVQTTLEEGAQILVKCKMLSVWLNWYWTARHAVIYQWMTSHGGNQSKTKGTPCDSSSSFSICLKFTSFILNFKTSFIKHLFAPEFLPFLAPKMSTLFLSFRAWNLNQIAKLGIKDGSYRYTMWCEY